MPESSLPLSALRELASSFRGTSNRPWPATSSRGDCANSCECCFCLRWRRVPRPTLSFVLAPRRIAPSLPRSARTFTRSSNASAVVKRRARFDAYGTRPLRSRISGNAFTDPAGLVPLLSKLFRVRHRSARATRRDSGQLARVAQDCPVSSVPTWRIRPGSLRPGTTSHG